MFLRSLTIVVVLSAVAACSSSPKGGRPGGGQVGVNQPSALLSKARDTQAQQGCARAIPAYRIVSSYGAGYEVAQFELGACLLEVATENTTEEALFRSEGLLWLRRAAWAGNPRAQAKLAEVLSGLKVFSDERVASDPIEAMMWATIYDRNGSRNVFSLPDIPNPVVNHITGQLSPTDLALAQERAAAYRKIEMASFVPPEGARGQEGSRGENQRGQGKRQRRR